MAVLPVLQSQMNHIIGVLTKSPQLICLLRWSCWRSEGEAVATEQELLEKSDQQRYFQLQQHYHHHLEQEQQQQHSLLLHPEEEEQPEDDHHQFHRLRQVVPLHLTDHPIEAEEVEESSLLPSLSSNRSLISRRR
ncbi:hypothetical protein SK128_015216 [Halocaridina rubra]|uniref:Uncharacterized protein n=1 Tax=Halocaridina rubra TaxID=373956 RepID=A0AAN9AB70_HALRR